MAAHDKPRACLYCLCTDAAGCVGGCSWGDDGTSRDICSSCLDSENLAKSAVELFSTLGPRMRPPAPLASPAWTDLTFDQQQLLVMAHKRLVEVACAQMADELTDEASAALQTVYGIVTFIHARAPEQLEQEKPLVDIVTELLEPHIGSRIVVPGGLTL